MALIKLVGKTLMVYRKSAKTAKFLLCSFYRSWYFGWSSPSDVDGIKTFDKVDQAARYCSFHTL